MTEKTIREVSDLSGISISALRYYDEEGLFGNKLPCNERRHRVFDSDALSRLQQIMFYRELGLSISEIKNIFEKADNHSAEILNDQINQLRAQAKKYENLALLAEIARDYGISILDFHLDEEQIQQIVTTYRHAAEVDMDRIRNMSGSDRTTIATSLISLIQNLIRIRKDRDPHEKAFELIGQYESLLCSVLGIQSIPFKSMAKGIAGGGTVSNSLDYYGGKGFSKYIAEILTEYAKSRPQEEYLSNINADDYLQALFSMWA